MKKLQIIILSLAIISNPLLQASNDEYGKTRNFFAAHGLKYTDSVFKEPKVEATTKLYEPENNAAIIKIQNLLIHNGTFTIHQLQKLRQAVNQNPTRKDLKIDFINDEKRYGVRATTDIPKYSTIGRYTGIVRHQDAIENKAYAFRSFYLYKDMRIQPGDTVETLCDVTNELQIDASECGNVTRFINHDTNPNCAALDIMDKEGMPQILYLASKDIKAGEELTTNYGDAYDWTKDTAKKSIHTIISQ
jgi:hypothetical protein